MSRSRVAAALLVALIATAGCGTRGVDAYCDTFYGEGQEFRQRWIDTNAAGDPVGTLVQLLAVPRDLAVFFGKLADVAPEDIRSDVETIRDLYQAQADDLGDDAADLFAGPASALGGIAGDLMSGLAAAPALQRVDTWTTTHCGPPPTT